MRTRGSAQQQRPQKLIGSVSRRTAERVTSTTAPTSFSRVTMERIYLSVPHMSGHEQPFIAEAFRTNWLTSAGANVDGFEREVSDRLARRHTLAVTSGTAALHLVLRYLGVGV